MACFAYCIIFYLDSHLSKCHCYLSQYINLSSFSKQIYVKKNIQNYSILNYFKVIFWSETNLILVILIKFINNKYNYTNYFPYGKMYGKILEITSGKFADFFCKNYLLEFPKKNSETASGNFPKIFPHGLYYYYYYKCKNEIFKSLYIFDYPRNESHLIVLLSQIFGYQLLFPEEWYTLKKNYVCCSLL